jgi:ribosomal protein S18 acetylase RimI-like enzyme
VEEVYLHVQVRAFKTHPPPLARADEDFTCASQTSNTEAVAFYKHFGFEVVETVAGYYKRLDPPDAYILNRNLKTWQPPEGGLSLPGDDETNITLDAA